MSTISHDSPHWHPDDAHDNYYRLVGSPLRASVSIVLTLGGWMGHIVRGNDGAWWKLGPFKNLTTAQKAMRKRHDRALLGEWPHDLYLVPDIMF